jgi:hypothetical protein
MRRSAWARSTASARVLRQTLHHEHKFGELIPPRRAQVIVAPAAKRTVPMVESFAQLFKRHRVVAGLSQERLGELAGVSTDAIGARERGARIR